MVNMLTYHLQLTMKNKTMPFLDLQIIREDEIIITTVYVKPIFSGAYTHFDSFLSSTFSVCSNWSKLHTELLF